MQIGLGCELHKGLYIILTPTFYYYPAIIVASVPKDSRVYSVLSLLSPAPSHPPPSLSSISFLQFLFFFCILSSEILFTQKGWC